jgi:glycosyltransferase involved in cell wall biosynthesis
MLWPVRIIGHGPQARALHRATRILGLGHRVTIKPFSTDRDRLAEIFATAGCVVNPGDPGRCQLALLEAAATGAPIVAPQGAPITTIAPALTHAFPDDDVAAAADAIQAALAARPDPELGARVAEENTWTRAFDRELEELGTLIGP